jgi:hypothetical protein
MSAIYLALKENIYHLSNTKRCSAFDDLIRNVSSPHFNASCSMFTVPASQIKTSLYWVHVGIEVPSSAGSHFQLDNTPLALMKHFMTSNTPTILSKSLVAQLKPNTSVSISSKANMSVSVNTAYWSGFQLNNLMYPSCGCVR